MLDLALDWNGLEVLFSFGAVYGPHNCAFVDRNREGRSATDAASAFQRRVAVAHHGELQCEEREPLSTNWC